MNITTQITERDKRLLIFLAVFILLAGFGWLIIKPMVNDIGEINSDIDLAQSQRMATDYSLNQISRYEESLTKEAKDYAGLAGDFYPLMESQEIDSLLTLKALNSGFAKSDLRELSISYPDSELIMLPYLSEADVKEEPALSGIYAADVSFTIYGTREKLENFIDTMVNSDESVAVTSFVWQEDRSGNGEYLLTMKLRVYMADSEGTAKAAQTLIDGHTN